MFKDNLDKHRLESYNHYIENLDPSDPNMWRATRKILRQPQITPTLRVAGQAYSEDQKKGEVFANHLEQVFDTTY